MNYFFYKKYFNWSETSFDCIDGTCTETDPQVPSSLHAYYMDVHYIFQCDDWFSWGWGVGWPRGPEVCTQCSHQLCLWANREGESTDMFCTFYILVSCLYYPQQVLSEKREYNSISLTIWTLVIIWFRSCVWLYGMVCTHFYNRHELAIQCIFRYMSMGILIDVSV